MHRRGIPQFVSSLLAVASLVCCSTAQAEVVSTGAFARVGSTTAEGETSATVSYPHWTATASAFGTSLSAATRSLGGNVGFDTEAKAHADLSYPPGSAVWKVAFQGNGNLLASFNSYGPGIHTFGAGPNSQRFEVVVGTTVPWNGLDASATASIGLNTLPGEDPDDDIDSDEVEIMGEGNDDTSVTGGDDIANDVTGAYLANVPVVDYYGFSDFMYFGVSEQELAITDRTPLLFASDLAFSHLEIPDLPGGASANYLLEVAGQMQTLASGASVDFSTLEGGGTRSVRIWPLTASDALMPTVGFRFAEEGATRVFQSVIVPIGDLNHDSWVDIFDVGIVSDNWDQTGEPGIPGDANKNGVVDIFDVGTVSDNWFPNPGGASVPEPSSIVLVGLGAMLLMWRARRSR